MAIITRRLLGILSFAVLPVLAACPGEFGGGYDKVAYRERTPLAMAAAPEPPPFVATVGAAGAAGAPTLPAGAPAGVTQAMVEEGQQLYGTVCTACHGPGGAGTPAGPQLNDQEWLNVGGGFDEIVGVIQTGVPTPVQFPGMMPPLGGGSFSPDQVRALAAYILALSSQAGA